MPVVYLLRHAAPGDLSVAVSGVEVAIVDRCNSPLELPRAAVRWS